MILKAFKVIRDTLDELRDNINEPKMGVSAHWDADRFFVVFTFHRTDSKKMLPPYTVCFGVDDFSEDSNDQIAYIVQRIREYIDGKTEQKVLYIRTMTA